MSPPTHKYRFFLAALSLGMLVMLGEPSHADDRDLFRSSSGAPYVMTIIDTSGSMSRDLAGETTTGSSDDPAARLFLAKSALYEVVTNLDPTVRLGWAHFEQEGMSLTSKLFLYQRDPASLDPPWWSDLPHPALSEMTEFGGDMEETGSCSSPDQLADVSPLRKLGYEGDEDSTYYVEENGKTFEIIYRAVPAAKWGRSPMEVTVDVRQVNSDCVTIKTYASTSIPFVGWYEQDDEGNTFSDAAGGLGFDYVTGRKTESSLGWDPNNNTATGTGDDEGPLTYVTLADPLGRADGGTGAFNRGDVIAWDWVEHPAQNPPAMGYEMSARQELLCRLAPNTCVSGEFDLDGSGVPIPDFRVARYFQNTPTLGECASIYSGSRCLPLKPQFASVDISGNNRRLPPIMNGGGTPIGDSLQDFHTYLGKWEPLAKDPTTGDPDYDCREKYVLMLTDGQNNVGDVEVWTKALFDDFGVRTFAVSFNSAGGSAWRDLPTLADWGGTGRMDRNNDGVKDCEEFTYTDGLGVTKNICDTRDPNGDIVTDSYSPCPTPEVGGECKIEGPIIAGSRDALVQQLNNLFTGVSANPKSFAGAGVPGAQTEAKNSLFLTSFIPVESSGTWPGALNHFVRPLPLVQVDGKYVADTSASCLGLDPVVGCFAWNAQDRMRGIGTGAFDQVPAVSEITSASDLDTVLGAGTDMRRIYYAPVPSIPTDVGLDKRLFTQPTTALAKYDLWDGLGLSFIPADPVSEAAAELAAFGIIKTAIVEKSAIDPRDETATLSWILGDIFHSDPVVLGAPNRFDYMSANLGGSGPCRDAAGDFDPTNKGYRCFFEKHRLRRKVLFVGANDAQLHAIDAGSYEYSIVDDELKGEFNVGTGQELFSYIPRTLLPRVAELALPRATQEFSLDGTVLIDDVFIDPDHAGAPTDSQREWRSVLVGGLREGGVGYHALDITQPDWVIQENDQYKVMVPDDKNDYVPSCLTNYEASRCGPVPYPSVLWEFKDLDVLGMPADEGRPGLDLGSTWSKPNTGRIRVCSVATAVGIACPPDKIVEKFVMVFGGGLDPADITVGNWLYMVDIETGQAIYKAQLDGPAPSEPAAVDTDRDGFLDTIYIGTTTGFLYKADISEPVELVFNALVSGGERVMDSRWEPFTIFDTGGRPLFHPPSVIFAALEGRYALSFTTGNREDLWAKKTPAEEGRFYTILDAGLDGTTTFDESSLMPVLVNSTVKLGNLLSSASVSPGGLPGYYLVLGPHERGITQPLTISGITIFSTFVPGATVAADKCSSTGSSNVYTIFTSSGNALGNSGRYRQVEGLVSNPFAESSSRETIDKDGDGVPDGTPTGDDMSDELVEIMETLKSEMSNSCRFSNVTINIKAIRTDTGVEFIAPIPVCMVAKNWKEH